MRIGAYPALPTGPNDSRSEIRVSAAGSVVDAFVIPTNEEFPIARAAQDLGGTWLGPRYGQI
jgi:hypothetical protein